MTGVGRWTAPLLGILASAGLLAETRGLDEVAREGQLGPAFWPRLVLLGLAGSCAAKLLPTRRTPGAAAGLESGLPPISPRTLAGAIALILLYVVAVPWLGFPIATAAFIIAFMCLGGSRGWPVTAAGLGGTVLLLYIFVKVVYLPLPKGGGPLEAFTVGLYRLLGIF